MGGGDEYSGDGGLEAARLFFRPGAESPLETLVMGRTRVKKELIRNNSSNSKLADSREQTRCLKFVY